MKVLSVSLQVNNLKLSRIVLFLEYCHVVGEYFEINYLVFKVRFY
jgi:hypothetical protein